MRRVKGEMGQGLARGRCAGEGEGRTRKGGKGKPLNKFLRNENTLTLESINQFFSITLRY